MSQRSPELTEAISAMIVQQPFFAVLMLDLLEVVEDKNLPFLAATDAKRLYTNPTRFNKLSIKERIFVLSHEILHVVHLHPARMKQYSDRAFGPDLKPWNQMKYNRAADYVINRMLCDAQVGKMPMNALYHPDITANDLVDEVYCTLPDEPDDKSQGGDGSENWDGHLPGDSNGPDKSQVQRALKSAQNAAKSQGKMPRGMQRLVDEICEPQVTWSEKIRKAFTNMALKDTSTWRRPNRRKLAIAPHVYWPGRAGTSAGKLVVEVDMSGSVGDTELSVFFGELHGILTDVRPEKIYVMFVDSQLYQNKVFEIDDPNELLELRQKAGGGGGTDMTVVFKEIEDRQIEAEYVIVLTDGYTPFGEPQHIPTIWCITTDQVSPWGETVHVKIPSRAAA